MRLAALWSRPLAGVEPDGGRNAAMAG